MRLPPAARPIRLLLLAAACAAPAAPLLSQSTVDRVSGVVKNEKGQGIAGAMVVAENGRATPHLFTGVTDETGVFVLVGLQSGDWNFSASAPGYLLSLKRARVARTTSLPSVELVLRRNAGRDAESDAAVARMPLAGVDIQKLQTSLENADTLLAAGHYDEAIAAYQEIRRRTPALTMVALQVGNAWRLKSDYDRAIAAYREVLAAEPGNQVALEAIGTTQLERGQPNAAEESLGAAARRPDATRGILCALGDVKAAQGQQDAAADWYRKCAATDPSWSRPQLKLGLLAADRGDASAAVPLLERAMRLEPSSREAVEAEGALRRIRKK